MSDAHGSQLETPLCPERSLRRVMASLLPAAMLPVALRAARRVRNASWALWRARIRRRAEDVTATMSTTRCLVLAAHPDDEALGCAATIARKAAAGGAVMVVVATDGGRGVLSSDHAASADELRTHRHRELLEACGRLGVPPRQVIQLGHPDGALAEHHATVVTQLKERFRTFLPEEVLVTWQRDPHPDHRALSAAVTAAIDEYPQIRHLEYPVHAWVRGPWVDETISHRADRLRRSLTERFAASAAPRVLGVRTGRFVETKRSAIAAYASQLDDAAAGATWGALGPEFVAPFLADHEFFFLVDRDPRPPHSHRVSGAASSTTT